MAPAAAVAGAGRMGGAGHLKSHSRNQPPDNQESQQEFGRHEDTNRANGSESANVCATGATRGVNVKVDWQEKSARAKTRVCRDAEVNNEQISMNWGANEGGPTSGTSVDANEALNLASRASVVETAGVPAAGSGFGAADGPPLLANPKPRRGSENSATTSKSTTTADRSIQTTAASIAIKVDCDQEDELRPSHRSSGKSRGGGGGSDTQLAYDRTSSGSGEKAAPRVKESRIARNNREEQQESQQLSPSPSIATANSNIADFYRLGNVDDVRRDFIRLIRHNRVQYFYLGAIIYSVMNFGFILHSSMKNRPLAGDSARHNGLNGGGGGGASLRDEGYTGGYSHESALGFVESQEFAQSPAAQLHFAPHTSPLIDGHFGGGRRHKIELNLLAKREADLGDLDDVGRLVADDSDHNNRDQSGGVFSRPLKRRRRPRHRGRRLHHGKRAVALTTRRGRELALRPNDSRLSGLDGLGGGGGGGDDYDDQAAHEASAVAVNRSTAAAAVAAIVATTSVAFDAHLGLWLTFGALLPLTLLLALIAAITTVQFGWPSSRGSTNQTAAGSAPSRSLELDQECGLQTEGKLSNATQPQQPQVRVEGQPSQPNRWWWPTSWNSIKLKNVMRTSGLLATLLILHLPLLCRLILAASGQGHTGVQVKSTTNVYQDLSSAASESPAPMTMDQWPAHLVSGDTQPSSSRPQAPTIATDMSSLLAAAGFGTTLTLLYLEPILIEGSELGVALACTCTSIIGLLLPTVQLKSALALIAGHNDDSNINNRDNHNAELSLANFASLYLVLASAQAIALGFGLLKRHQFRRMVTKSTFAGAAQLIEARVSLEHQRQQQETLLLSVLPAYVAEQVKRNMVKKMNSSVLATSGGGASFEASNNQASGVSLVVSNAMGSSSAIANPLHMPTPVQLTTNLANSWLKTITTAVPAPSATLANQHHAHVREVISHQDSETTASGACGSNLLAPNPPSQRSSFSRLSAGVAFISETLGANGSKTHQHRLSSTSMPANPHPSQGAGSRDNGSSNHLSVSTHNVLQVGCNSITSTTSHHQQQQQQQSFIFVPPQPTSGCQLMGASNHQARRGFNELYIRTYNNVSLLYGDIVGFTRLCTQLSSSQLVRVLNDLFSHFDRLAERHKIMRIKILGDCYYGVSGIPEFAVMGSKSRACRNDNHAVNCVNMGLDMIQYIKCLNVERASRGADTFIPHSASIAGTSTTALASATTSEMDEQLKRGVSGCSINKQPNASQVQLQQQQQHHHQQQQQRPIQACKSVGNCTPMPQFELNMRIGIHSGHIHSGVIGLKKWQFDVWSNDVSIAMHCESSGIAGRVQVTESTIQQLNGTFTYESASSAGDSFLASRDIRTYLIRDRVNSRLQPGDGSFNRLSVNKMSDTMASLSSPPPPPAGSKKAASAKQQQQQQQQQQLRCKSDSREAKNDKSKADNEGKIRSATIETIKETILAGETCNSNASNSYGLALNHPDISVLRLRFRDSILNKLYANRQLGCYHLELLVFVILFVITLPLLNLLFQEGTQLWPTLILAAILFVVFALDFLSSKSPRNITTKSPRSSVINNYGNQPPVGEPANYISARDLDAALDFNQANQDTSNELTPDGGNTSNNKRKTKFITQILGRVLKWRASVRRLMAAIGKFLFAEFPRGRLRSLVSASVILAVIANQSYFISCIDSKESNNGHGELHQASVIVILIAIDLSNYLMTHGSKILLLACVLATQVVYLMAERNKFKANRFDFDLYATRADVFDWTSETLLLVVISFSLTFARQIEYTNRANFLWRNRLNVDHEELEYISGINKVLLENILPSHVVQHYLTNPSEQQKSSQFSGTFPRMSFSNMRNLSDELYHEQHESVAVMFASIPHFYEFYDESDISKQGLGCIALLNEIICDFDKLLLKNKFSRIEKIKTIGSTYMAAAGLRPSNLTGARSSTVSQGSQRAGTSQRQPADSCHTTGGLLDALANCNEAEGRKLVMSQQKLNLVCMVQFATSLMTALNGINKQSFQVFKLRVGVNTGPVIAGIIGAQRPFYDIWGDCVNIASRMESLGEIGRIQVEERTAKLLMESLCSETYSIVRRGPIDVKGKGGMVTYFVDKRSADHGQDLTQINEPGSSQKEASGQTD